MADERKIQTEGPAHSRGGREPYPPVRQDDAIEGADRSESDAGERRSFAPTKDAPSQPPQGAGDIDEGLLGPRGDPAEGRR